MFKYKMILILNYYSTWIILGTFLYLLASLVFPNSHILRSVDLYYSNVFMCIGFCLFVLYLLCVKHYQFEMSFLLVLTLLHFIPLYLISLYPVNPTVSRKTLLLTLGIYFVYVCSHNKTPFHVYLIDDHPRTFKELLLSLK